MLTERDKQRKTPRVKKLWDVGTKRGCRGPQTFLALGNKQFY